MTAFELAGKLKLDSSEFSSSLKQNESSLKNFGSRLSTWTVAKGQMVARFAEKTVGAVANVIRGAVNESMSFEKSMAQVAATMGKSVTDTEIQQLSEFARKMGAETAFTAQEAAQGLNYMALAGYDAQKSMKMLPQVLNLAAAGNFDLARASDMVTDAQSALGLTTEGTETLIDQMAMTASKSNTSVEQLGDAILTVGGTAKIMGDDTEQLNATLGILADNGIKGAEGGTMLRNVLLALSAPTDKASQQLKKLGVSVFDSSGNMRNMEDIMLDMGEAMDGMTQEQRTSIINDIFNKRDLKAVEALLGTTEDRWEELLGSISGSKGAASKMADTQLDNLAGDATKFNSALGEAKLTLVEGLTPYLRRFTQTGTRLVQRLTAAFKEKGLSGAIDEGKKIFKDFVDNMKNSEDPAVRTVGKIASIFANGLSWDSLKDVISGAWDTVIAGFNGLGKIIFGENADGTTKWPTWDDVGKFVTSAWDTIKDGFMKLGALVFGENTDGTVKWPTWDDVKDAADKAWQDIQTGLGTIAQWVLGTPEMPTAHDVGLAVNKWWNDTAKPFIDGIFNFLLGTPGMEDENGESTKGLIEHWWDTIIVPALKGILDFTLGLFGLPSVDDMIKKINDWWDDVKSKVTLVINAVFGGVEGGPKEIGRTTDAEGNTYIEYENGGFGYESAEGGGGAGHSFAKGLLTVPYDNYPALLHRGEQVLTASQARKNNEVDYAYIGEMVGGAVKDALKHMYLNMDGKKVADYTTRRTERNISTNSLARVRGMGG